MRAPAIQTSQARVAAWPHRLINPLTGYGLAILGSVAFWALLLSAIF